MILLDNKDLYINFENNDSNMIIVTGISGSGKSFLSQELYEKYKYEIISFDMIFDYEEGRERTKLELKILNGFKKKYKNYKELEKDTICNLFFDYVKGYIEKEKIKIIFDGYYFLRNVDFNKIKEEKIVLKRTSLIRSLIRRTRRNQRYIKKNNYSIIRKIKEYYWLHIYNYRNICRWYNDEKYFIEKIKEGNLTMNKKDNLSTLELRDIQINGLLYLKDICNKNNINYYIISGTLLGAVKYKGYIPWDDDIDIALKRKDYLKLIKILEEENNSLYKVLTMDNTKDYYYPYAKLVNTKTKLIENAKEIKELGVFIDIFPLDYYDENILDIYNKTHFIRNMTSKRMRIKNSIKKTTLLKKEVRKITHIKIKKVIYNLVDIVSLPLGYNFWVKLLDKKLSNNNDGKYLGILYIDEYKYFDKNIFDEIEEYEFENHKFTSIKEYDKYLRQLYGDYRQDPPVEKQCTHHQMNVFWRKNEK